MCWPLQGPLIVGLADGKIRASFIKNNKASTLYNTDSYVVSLASNNEGTGFLSGHADGSIVRWYVAEDEKTRPQVSIISCSVNTRKMRVKNIYIFLSSCLLYTSDAADE